MPPEAADPLQRADKTKAKLAGSPATTSQQAPGTNK